MDSYIVRIYRRAGRKPRILVGTVESPGIRRRIAFTNVEELWEILGRRKAGNLSPNLFRRRKRKEVMGGTGLEESAEGVRRIKSASES